MIIRLYKDPFRPTCETFEATSLAEWLLARYAGSGPRKHHQVYAGEPSAETDITGNREAILRGDAPEYVVLEAPGIPGAPFLVNMVLSMAVSAALNDWMVKTPKPLTNQSVNSPNNQLSDRQNQERTMQRVEDIYGTVRSIPTLLMPTYNKYIQHNRVEYGLYCVGRGFYDITDVREGDTLLSEINGASAAIYPPFNTPNSGFAQQTIGDAIIDNVLTVRRSSSVDGIVLKVQNQITLQPVADYVFRGPGSDDGTGVGLPTTTEDIIWQSEGTGSGRRPNFASIAAGGQQITISGTGIPGYDGTRTISGVGNGYVTLVGPAQFSSSSMVVPSPAIAIDNGLTDWTDWFTLPATDRTEVWANVVAQQGMYKDDGSKQGTSVSYEIQVEQLASSLAPTGLVETLAGNISGDTSNERAETLERVTAWSGPARVRARRTTPFDYDFKGAVVDEIKWMDLYSVSPVTAPHFGNKTIIHAVTRTTQGSASVQRRELNCLASRKLPIFNGASFSGTFDGQGGLATGTIAATSRIVDILGAVALDPKIGGLTLADLDMPQMWATQQALDAWNMECGQFNYTFDSEDLSFEETAQAIANTAFCTAYRQNGKIRLALDRPQAASAALFTHRNKKPNAETITRTFATDSEYDGVELVYVDPETEKQETIRLPLDGSWTKLKKVEISGIRSYQQAWFRANREYNRLRSQRVVIDTQTTGDARALLPNVRIDIVDNTRFKSFDGEVVGQSGLTLTLSCDVEFTAGVAHSVVLMKRDGSVQSIPCNPGAEANQVVLTSAPAEAIVTSASAGQGIRTIFSFAPDSARAAMAYLVQSIDISDGQYVRIQGVNYSDDYYTADALPIPAKNSVIN